MADLSLESYWQLPPLSRTVATAAFVLSVGVHVGLLPGWWFVFYPRFLWMIPPQIWRFGTAFLLTGPALGLLFDTYFLYSYLSQLEVGNPRFSRREDLAWYLIFVGGTIMTINYFTNFGFVTFLQALILAMCYTVTQDQRGGKVSYMFISIPAQLTPYAMILFNLLFPGGVMNMILQIQGLLAAHLYEFLTRVWPEYGGGRNLIPTPAFLTTVLRAAGTMQTSVAAAAGIQTADHASGQGTGASRGPLPDSWRTRGPGRRLG
ncbi:der1-like family protein [Hirsutella rhossiliensis]|uniref:Derlin n=1 Tax=Hirsutella rhossiliensis TaxID=111463 RepID=A0A9P8N1D6_9HYPO|nr:der1-like family domain-containing protein [Hirsutella rhossiliensis]KAH0965064.1 der1-like family domain-containing protein [Hirsutella rhossiliensis]